MKIKIAYIEEPPFYWTAADHSVTGADIELAKLVLEAIGASSIEYVATSFEELIPGVQEGRWDMNVPIFITPEREKQVAFSSPVWAIGDGFLVHRGNPMAVNSYQSVAGRSGVRLGLIPGQVQVDAAKSAGVNDQQVTFFKDQPTAIISLLSGEIDVFASTAVGSRLIASTHPELDAIADESKNRKVLFGGFSFHQSNQALVRAVNEQLRKYLGSNDHRARMEKYGIMSQEIESVL